MTVNALKTHCPQGHPYDEVNTYPMPSGGRGCRACRKTRGAAFRRSLPTRERKACDFVGCERLQWSRGLCKSHYQIRLSEGQLRPIRRYDKSARSRRGQWPGCWEWSGYRTEKSYGQVRVDGRLRIVHRVVYEAVFGPIPEGLFVCHHCDNPPCFRPDHLFLGTNLDNMTDMKRKGRGRRSASFYALGIEG